MLRPSKHAHPDRTVVNLSLLLLMRLKLKRLDSYDELRGYAKKTVKGSDALFCLRLISSTCWDSSTIVRRQTLWNT